MLLLLLEVNRLILPGSSEGWDSPVVLSRQCGDTGYIGYIIFFIFKGWVAEMLNKIDKPMLCTCAYRGGDYMTDDDNAMKEVMSIMRKDQCGICGRVFATGPEE